MRLPWWVALLMDLAARRDGPPLVRFTGIAVPSAVVWTTDPWPEIKGDPLYVRLLRVPLRNAADGHLYRWDGWLPGRYV